MAQFGGWCLVCFLSQIFPVLLILSIIKNTAMCGSLNLWYIVTVSLEQRFSTRDGFCLLRTFVIVWRVLVVITWGLVRLASSGQRPEMLLNILQFRGWSPHKENYFVKYVNRANIEIPCPKKGSLELLLNVLFFNQLIRRNMGETSKNVSSPPWCSEFLRSGAFQMFAVYQWRPICLFSKVQRFHRDILLNCLLFSLFTSLF